MTTKFYSTFALFDNRNTARNAMKYTQKRVRYVRGFGGAV